jgi:Zn-dependent membrane protease YugP
MLQHAGLDGTVRIERVAGTLSDHYDPRAKVVRLSRDVHDSNSLAALGVACHEVGHAIQDARRYAPLVIRNMAVPVANFGSGMSMTLIMIGVILMVMGMAGLGQAVGVIGVLLFGTVVAFQIINLPVEFDASARAKILMPQLGLISGRQEQRAVNSVLNAAAMTYVAATIVALLQLLYWAYRMGLIGGRR